MEKKKIINDPIYGFITLQGELVYQLIEHRYMQRLRRIKQLGLTDYVYPGALHTRFHHALGATHLMCRAVDTLQAKGHEITTEEAEAAQIAILLHDVGHGPFSHALEHSLLNNVPHEQISVLLMNELNKQFNGKLTTAIAMFNNSYPRKFFHQLISSQLDTDRLDYLQRDCFYTGVIEGRVALDRIIRMLDVVDDEIVVEEKGIYSIENFLNSRRLMYWQVYMHKTTVSTEQMLGQLLSRARHLAQQGVIVPATPALTVFIRNFVNLEQLGQSNFLETFASLDDHDIWGSLKFWVHHDDVVLQRLSAMLLSRNLLKVQLYAQPTKPELLELAEQKLQADWGITPEQAKYFCSAGSISNAAYVPHSQRIMIKQKSGEVLDIGQASDLPNISALSKIVRKYYLCHPKGLSL